MKWTVERYHLLNKKKVPIRHKEFSFFCTNEFQFFQFPYLYSLVVALQLVMRYKPSQWRQWKLQILWGSWFRRLVSLSTVSISIKQMAIFWWFKWNHRRIYSQIDTLSIVYIKYLSWYQFKQVANYAIDTINWNGNNEVTLIELAVELNVRSKWIWWPCVPVLFTML